MIVVEILRSRASKEWESIDEVPTREEADALVAELQHGDVPFKSIRGRLED